MVKLDEIDRSILRILQDDARTPIAKMARQLKIGETTVRFRMKRLRKNGIITRFTALIDPRKVGLSVTSMMMVKIAPNHFEKAFERLASLEEVHHVFQSTGGYDLVVIAHARDMAHLNELVRRIKMIPGVKDLSVSVATGLLKIETRLKL